MSVVTSDELVAARAARLAKPKANSQTNGKSAPEEDWRDRLLYTGGKNRKIDRCVANAVVILSEDPQWSGVIAWDEFAQSVITTKTPPWADADRPAVCKPGEWSDTDTVRLHAWLHRRYSLKLGRDAVYDAVRAVAERRPVHPVRDWLGSIEWDGQPRVDRWLSRYLGADASTYTSLVGRWFLVGAVARIFEPGCKLDTMLVLEGPQGLGKSTARRILFGNDWSSDTPVDLESKDRFVSVRSRWCIEFAELDSLKRSGVDRIKSFLSSATDSYRPPYGRGLVNVPRSCVFLGTVNGSSYLTDETGNRRFHPVACGSIDLTALADDRSQLWAEAIQAYRTDPRWWPLGGELASCVDAQAAREQRDAWSDLIDPYLVRQPPDAFVTVADVLRDVLRLDVGKWTQNDQTRVARCLSRAGWLRKQRRDGMRREWGYVTSVTGASPDAGEKVVTE